MNYNLKNIFLINWSNPLGILGLVFCLFLVACEPSMEDLEKQWKTTTASANKYAAKFPILKDKINTQLEIAKPIMEAAKRTSDEDMQKNKVKDAITVAKKGALGTIMKLEKSIEAVKKHEKYFKAEVASEHFTAKTRLLIDDARLAINEGETRLNGTYTSADSAYALFENSSNKLTELNDVMRKHRDEIRKLNRKAKKEEAALKKKEREQRQNH